MTSCTGRLKVVLVTLNNVCQLALLVTVNNIQVANASAHYQQQHCKANTGRYILERLRGGHFINTTAVWQSLIADAVCVVCMN
jgi:hypothetical protein